MEYTGNKFYQNWSVAGLQLDNYCILIWDSLAYTPFTWWSWLVKTEQ